MATPPAEITRKIDDLVKEGIDLKAPRAAFNSDPFWKGLRDLGTELWLDTGDIEGARKLWAQEFSALTTNNTLLNNEVQKGLYDDTISRAAKVLAGEDETAQVREIGFILNARHGLRLAQVFGGKVSVELHTGLADDIDASVEYGRRIHRICPLHFIVKVPLTPSGLIATRKLRGEGIPINFTLGFSARHNYLAARFATPSYVNVFLGRLGSYIADNELGDGKLVGEKATLASQKAVEEISHKQKLKEPVRQIAASMRGETQVWDLAGVDVFTMPLAVAEKARKEQYPKWNNRRGSDYEVKLSPKADPLEVRWETLWEVTAAERKLAEDLAAKPPATARELVERARASGAKDLFPDLTSSDREQIARDGKIPKHKSWIERLKKKELAIDTLLNLAGLASFTKDQKDLDDRIRRLIGGGGGPAKAR